MVLVLEGQKLGLVLVLGRGREGVHVRAPGVRLSELERLPLVARAGEEELPSDEPSSRKLRPWHRVLP